MDDLNCYNKLYDYVVEIYKDLDRGYIHDLYNSHNELKRKIGNVLITLGSKIGMFTEQIKAREGLNELMWREEFR